MTGRTNCLMGGGQMTTDDIANIRVYANPQGNSYSTTVTCSIGQVIHVVAIRLNATATISSTANGATNIKSQNNISGNSAYYTGWYVATSTTVTISVSLNVAGFLISIN